MEKRDMVDLIMCFEAWTHLNEVVSELTGGYCIDHPKYSDLDRITEIIRRNSRYPGTNDSDVDARMRCFMMKALMPRRNSTG